jgi:BMFP domain-containing protein YqiC
VITVRWQMRTLEQRISELEAAVNELPGFLRDLVKER